MYLNLIYVIPNRNILIRSFNLASTKHGDSYQVVRLQYNITIYASDDNTIRTSSSRLRVVGTALCTTSLQCITSCENIQYSELQATHIVANLSATVRRADPVVLTISVVHVIALR